ncbi:hypothetical protein [Massilia orientalis]|uniref:Uncharacterized protein n=1 Tax=Massilia orientalis TaxID=3050128 RepID=A0ACC7MFL7_9BURK|nr:hypothetical protein [Massilia sp. YIM B02787]
MSAATDAVRAAAVRMLDALIASAGEGRAPFRCLTAIYLNGAAMPMLMVGRADGQAEDGEAIVLLNPDEDLLDRLAPGVGYHGGLLKEIVSGKCDAMMHVWLDAYVKGPDRAKVLASYTTRTPAGAPKFQVK